MATAGTGTATRASDWPNVENELLRNARMCNGIAPGKIALQSVSARTAHKRVTGAYVGLDDSSDAGASPGTGSDALIGARETSK